MPSVSPIRFPDNTAGRSCDLFLAFHFSVFLMLVDFWKLCLLPVVPSISDPRCSTVSTLWWIIYLIEASLLLKLIFKLGWMEIQGGLRLRNLLLYKLRLCFCLLLILMWNISWLATKNTNLIIRHSVPISFSRCVSSLHSVDVVLRGELCRVTHCYTFCLFVPIFFSPVFFLAWTENSSPFLI